MLVTRVTYVKEGAEKTFTIVDAAMNELLRPTLYEAYHDIRPVAELRSDMSPVQQDVAGPVCETGDYLAQDLGSLPAEAGDLLAVMTAGAYGAVMSSTYNLRSLGSAGARQRRSVCRRPASAKLRRPDPRRRAAGLACERRRARSSSRRKADSARVWITAKVSMLGPIPASAAMP